MIYVCLTRYVIGKTFKTKQLSGRPNPIGEFPMQEASNVSMRDTNIVKQNAPNTYRGTGT